MCLIEGQISSSINSNQSHMPINFFQKRNLYPSYSTFSSKYWLIQSFFDLEWNTQGLLPLSWTGHLGFRIATTCTVKVKGFGWNALSSLWWLTSLLHESLCGNFVPLLWLELCVLQSREVSHGQITVFTLVQ